MSSRGAACCAPQIADARTYERIEVHVVANFFGPFVFLCVVWPVHAQAQDKIKVAYSSTDTLNQIWTIAQDAGFYKKNGLDVDLVYIGSTTVGVTAIVAQDIQVGNAAGSGVANAAVRGADMVSVGCTINVLAYELVVLDSIKSAGRFERKVDRHQPLWQCLGRCCAGVAQRLGIATAWKT